ncbi:MAG: OmpA family protein [Sphingobacteriaceae bacterium]
MAFQWFNSLGQEGTTPHAELSEAKQVILNKTYSFPSSAKGFGRIQEFPEKIARSDYYFKKERNTIWLSMSIPFNGILSFEITPYSKADDYDWMLFYNTPDLKDQIKKGKAKLVRSNNCRNDKTLNGKTGIKNGFNNLFERPGPTNSYSKLLQVKKGQKLVLVIDNIYDSGAGFDFVSSLQPLILATRVLTGKVTDKNTLLPLAAKVICEDDSTGIKLAETTANNDGIFTLEIPADRPVNVTARYSGYIFQTFDLKKDKDDVSQNFALNQPGSTEKLLMYNIHFTPDKDLIKPNSEPELDRLIELLKQHKDWEVRVIGHTNNNPFADARYLQKLSFNRAIAVKQYLIENGVSEKRISCAGMGGKNPIVVTRNPEEGLKNLRVEVVLRRK